MTPPQIAKRLGVASEKVIGWIDGGELRAVNLSAGEVRPRWRIMPEDLAAFLASRANTPDPKQATKLKAPRVPRGVNEWV
jgi:excisionase family DNA binding protein